jgi:tetratricopeptide (TPR) repeat protein
MDQLRIVRLNMTNNKAHLTIGIFCLIATGATSADQSDSRLDALFVTIQQTTSINLANDAENKIWEIWLENDNQQTETRLADGIESMNTDPDKALKVFDELISGTPDFAEAWNKRATLHYLLGDYPASLSDIEKTLALEPRHFGALSGLGLVYWVQGEYLKAKAAFEAVLLVHPHSTGVRRNIERINDHLRANSA